jgi:uncharacterized phosphosugar-binding protein
MLAKRYFEISRELLDRLFATQLKNVEDAAEVIAQSIADGHTLYAWGGPHSSLPVQDIFWVSTAAVPRPIVWPPTREEGRSG